MPDKIKVYRHGDICLIRAKSIPKEFVKSSSKTIVRGRSGGNSHDIDAGTLYFAEKADAESFIIGYLKAQGTSLLHCEHGTAKIPDGNYEIRKQKEWFPDGFTPVID